MEDPLYFSHTKSGIFDLRNLPTYSTKMEHINAELAKPECSYETIRPEIEHMFPEVQESTFASYLDEPFDDFFDFQVVIADLIGDNDINELYERPSEPLEQLLDGLRAIISSDFIMKLLDTYPVNLSLLDGLPREAKLSIAAVASLVYENKTNAKFLEWVGNAMVSQDWSGKTSGEIQKIRNAGLFDGHRGHGKFWVILTPSNEVRLLKYDDGQETARFHVDHIDTSRSGKTLRIWKDPKTLGARLVLDNTKVRDRWMSCDPLPPMSIPYYGPFVPNDLVAMFHHTLIQADTYVVRAILDPEVIKTGAAGEVMHDLYTVFAYNGLVHRLLLTTCAMEFSEHKTGGIAPMQSKSFLTELFRVFYANFGKPYYEQVIMPISMKVTEAGELGIKDGRAMRQHEVGELLNNAITRLVNEERLIPLEFRHMASVLKSVTTTAFGTRRNVYNILSSFFYIRFVTAILADPNLFEPDIALSPTHQQLVIPFAQLLQVPLGLDNITERYENAREVADMVVDRYTDIYNLAMRMAEIEQAPKYPAPTEDAVNKALLRIMEKLSASREAFISRYVDYYETDWDKSGVAFSLCELIRKMFK